MRNCAIPAPANAEARSLVCSAGSSVLIVGGSSPVAGWDGPLDIVVNNAGVMAIPELRRTGPDYGRR